MSTSLYTLTVDVTPAPTTTPDDALAIVVRAVDDLTIVETSSAVPVGAGVVNVKARFYGLNDREAAATALTAYAALRQSGGAVRAVDTVRLVNARRETVRL